MDLEEDEGTSVRKHGVGVDEEMSVRTPLTLDKRAEKPINFALHATSVLPSVESDILINCQSVVTRKPHFSPEHTLLWLISIKPCWPHSRWAARP